MSGHSKWHNIQKTKGAADAKRAQAFTKIAREMIVAVKEGGSGDPNNNSRLAAVITKAKAANMPNDNIKRTIDKALGAGNTDNYEKIVYEGYGPSGVAVIVETMTDNRNRTAGEIRHYFDKYGGNMGAANCVSTPAGGVQMNFGGAVRSELNDAACAEMLKCYREGGCDAYWRDGEPGTDNNIYKFIWKKVCVNATVNTVCAVLRLKIGEVEADPWGQQLFHGVIRETCAVATAKGVPMNADDFIAHDHADIVTNIGDYYPSMCQDALFHQRQTEIDVLNGKIAEYGKELGIPTPTCDILTKVVHCIQDNYANQYFQDKDGNAFHIGK